MSKPLFIPLKTKYFEAFWKGAKKVEIRKFGKRWNNYTCYAGREVVLSRGYGKHARLKGVIAGTRVFPAKELNLENQKAMLDVYNTLDILVIVVVIKQLRVVNLKGGNDGTAV